MFLNMNRFKIYTRINIHFNTNINLNLYIIVFCNEEFYYLFTFVSVGE